MECSLSDLIDPLPPSSPPFPSPLYPSSFCFVGQRGNFAIRYAALVSSAARSLLWVVVDDVADVHRFSRALFATLEQTHRALVTCDCNWVVMAFSSTFFFCFFLILTEVVYLQRCLVVTWLVPRETAAVSGHVLCTPYSHAPVCSVL